MPDLFFQDPLKKAAVVGGLQGAAETQGGDNRGSYFPIPLTGFQPGEPLEDVGQAVVRGVENAGRGIVWGLDAMVEGFMPVYKKGGNVVPPQDSFIPDSWHEERFTAGAQTLVGGFVQGATELAVGSFVGNLGPLKGATSFLGKAASKVPVLGKLFTKAAGGSTDALGREIFADFLTQDQHSSRVGDFLQYLPEGDARNSMLDYLGSANGEEAVSGRAKRAFESQLAGLAMRGALSGLGAGGKAALKALSATADGIVSGQRAFRLATDAGLKAEVALERARRAADPHFEVAAREVLRDGPEVRVPTPEPLRDPALNPRTFDAEFIKPPESFGETKLSQDLVDYLNKRDELVGTLTPKEIDQRIPLVPPADREVVGNFVDRLGARLFDKINLKIEDFGPDGSFDFAKSVMSVSVRAIRDGQFTRTMLHEAWHSLERYLSPENVVLLRRQFDAEKFATINKGGLVGKAVMDGRVISVEEGLKQGLDRATALNVASQTYRFKSVQEWWAESLTDKTLHALHVEQAKKLGDDTALRVLRGGRGWVAETARGFATKFGAKESDRLFKSFFSGRLKKAEIKRSAGIGGQLMSASDTSRNANKLLEDLIEAEKRTKKGFTDFAENAVTEDGRKVTPEQAALDPEIAQQVQGTDLPSLNLRAFVEGNDMAGAEMLFRTVEKMDSPAVQKVLGTLQVPKGKKLQDELVQEVWEMFERNPHTDNVLKIVLANSEKMGEHHQKLLRLMLITKRMLLTHAADTHRYLRELGPRTKSLAQPITDLELGLALHQVQMVSQIQRATRVGVSMQSAALASNKIRMGGEGFEKLDAALRGEIKLPSKQKPKVDAPVVEDALAPRGQGAADLFSDKAKAVGGGELPKPTKATEGEAGPLFSDKAKAAGGGNVVRSEADDAMDAYNAGEFADEADTPLFGDAAQKAGGGELGKPAADPTKGEAGPLFSGKADSTEAPLPTTLKPNTEQVGPPTNPGDLIDQSYGPGDTLGQPKEGAPTQAGELVDQQYGPGDTLGRPKEGPQADAGDLFDQQYGPGEGQVKYTLAEQEEMRFRAKQAAKENALLKQDQMLSAKLQAKLDHFGLDEDGARELLVAYGGRKGALAFLQAATLLEEGEFVKAAVRIGSKNRLALDQLKAGRGKIDLKAFTEMLNKTAGISSITDRVVEFYIGGLLSGLKTMTVAPLSGFVGTVVRTFELGVGGLLSSLERVSKADKINADLIVKEAKRVAAAPFINMTQMASDFMDSMRVASDAFWSEKNQTFTTDTLENTRNKANSARGYGLNPESTAGKVADVAGGIIRIPARIQSSSDEFFKRMFYRSDVARRAMESGLDRGMSLGDAIAYGRQMAEKSTDDTNGAMSRSRLYSEARKRLEEDPKFADASSETISKLANDEAGEEIRKLTESGEWDFYDKGRAWAEEATFTRKLDSDSNNIVEHTGYLLQSMLRKFPYMRILIPFVRTPINIHMYSSQRLDFKGAMESGAYGAAKLVRAVMRKTSDAETLLGMPRYGEIWSAKTRMLEELNSGNPKVASEALARLTTGIAAVTTVFMLGNKITGNGPTDPEKRVTWLAEHPASSVLVNGEWINYSRVDPGFIGVAADIKESFEGNEDGDVDQSMADAASGLAGALAISFSNNMLNKTYLSSVNEIISAAADKSGKKAERFIARTAASFIPNIATQGIAAGDPYMREIRGFVDEFRSRLKPSSLEVKRDALGRPRMRAKALGSEKLGALNYINPINSQTENKDPVDLEMARLKHGFSVPRPERANVSLLDPAYKLGNQTAFDKYMELSGTMRLQGKTLHESLSALISTSEYQRLPDKAIGLSTRSSPKATAITNVIERYRDAAFEETLRQIPALKEAVRTYERNAQKTQVPR